MRRKRDIRVLHINTARSWRGGERQVLFLARSLDERGVNQIVVCQPGSPIEKRCMEEKIPCMAVRMRGELDYFAAKKIQSIARNFHPNIIHAHTAQAHTIALFVKGLYPIARLVVSRRVDFPAKRGVLSRLKYHSKRIDLYLAISQNVKRVLLEDGIPEKMIRIAYSGIDLKEFVRLPSPQPVYQELFGDESKGDAGRVIIGSLGALEKHKDHETLIRAAAVLKKRLRGIPFSVIIAGDGSLRERLEALTVELGLLTDQHIIFLGFRNDTTRLYALFDLFCMPSREEGLGTAVLDAMASGLAVAAADAGGLPEMIDPERGGCLFPPGDPESLAVCLRKLIENPDIRNRMGRYNKKRVRDFSREATCEATVRAYAEILGHGAP